MLKAPNPSVESNDSKFGEGTSSSTQTWSSHKFRIAKDSMMATTNPLDNVPFVPTLPLGSSGSKFCTSTSASDLQQQSYYISLDRISVFLSTPSNSEYNFSLEKRVVEELTGITDK